MLHAQERNDTYKHKGLRKKLVSELRQKGITDENVLGAIEKIPRHFFLDPAFERIAYEDRAFPITAGQTISQPFTVSFQSQHLNIKPFDKVLEIGTGSAYQACVLAELGARVFTIERQRALFQYNNHFFYLQQYPGIRRFYGDGFEGLPSYAPFDKIIITAAAPFIPPKLIEQLKPGGRMILPVDEDTPESANPLPEAGEAGTEPESGVQKMKLICKTDTGIETETLGNFSFVPMLKGKNSH